MDRIDPLSDKFPFQSPYVTSGNSPIMMVDVEGAAHEYYNLTVVNGKVTKTHVKSVEAEGLKKWLGYKNSHRYIYKGQTYSFGDRSIIFGSTGTYVAKDYEAKFLSDPETWSHRLMSDETFDIAAKERIEEIEKVVDVGIQTFYYLYLGGKATQRRVAPGTGPVPEKISVNKTKKIFRESAHFQKWGRKMGYESKKDYRAGAFKFIDENANAESSLIREGTLNSRGEQFSSSQQISITNNGKTAVIDKKSGQVMDFFEGTALPAQTNVKVIKNGTK